MRVSLAPDRSLGTVVGEALQTQDPTYDFAGVIETWKRLLQYLLEPCGIAFLDTVSREEYISLSILREWWCRYRPIAESFIFHRMKPVGVADAQVEQVIPHYFDLEVHGVRYHHALSLLFIQEFTPEKSFRATLAGLRDRAVRVASTHNIARRFCLDSTVLYPLAVGQGSPEENSYAPVSSNKYRFDITATITACPWLSPDQYQGRPYYLWDVVNRRTVKTAEIGLVPYICINHTWGRWILKDSTGEPLTANIVGVPWPIPRNSKFDVESLPDLLQGASLPEKHVWFDLLCIPQCGYQQDIMESEIARQAAIFGTSRLTGAWLNDIEDWIGTQHALRLLSAQYFEQTSWGPGFRFEHKVPDVINPPPLRSPIRNINLSLLEQNANQPAHILNDRDEEDVLPRWFTSLWTLQEFCLRPDMILYDSHWRPLKITGDDLIYLDDFIALMHFAQATMTLPSRFHIFHIDFLKQRRWKSKKDELREMDRVDNELNNSIHDRPDIKKIWPAGPVELALLTSGTNLMHAYQGPSKILRFGDMRQCSGRRAEAIMSAIGAIDWYREYMKQVTVSSGQVISEPDLVLGKYPAVFLNEVVQRVGSDFFSSRLLHSELSARDVQKFFTSSMAPIGSLLPFSAGLHGVGFQSYQNMELETKIKDHPTVKSWTIQRNGTVTIREAGIMAVARKTSNSRIRKVFRCAKARSYWSRIKLDAPLLFDKGECDLFMTSTEELCAVVPSSIELYMVCLGDSPVESYGVILQKIPSADQSMEAMVKVGTWCSFNPSRPKDPTKYKFRSESDIVPSTVVNWQVM